MSNQSERDYQKGRSSVTNAAGKAFNYAKKKSSSKVLAAKASASGGTAGATAGTATGAAGAGATASTPVGWVIAIILAVVLIYIIFLLFITYTPPATSLDDKEADIGEVNRALIGGYEAKQEEAKKYIVESINAKYPEIQGTVSNLSDYDDGFIYSGDNYSINIEFGPEIDEFSALINAYANGVNATISAFSADDSSFSLYGDKSYTPQGALVNYDEKTGKFTPSDRLKSDLKKYNSEYLDSNSEDFFANLSDQSSSLFSVEDNTDEWSWDLSWRTKTITIDKCYLVDKYRNPTTKAIITHKTEVSCDTDYDEIEEEEQEIECLYGTVTVYMNCDITQYKKDIIKEIKTSLVGEEYIVQHYENGKSVDSKTTLDSELAGGLVDDAVYTYFTAYIANSSNDVYIAGYKGKVESSGFDYSQVINSSDNTSAEKFWAYSDSLTSIFDNLKYAKASGGYSGNKQCTRFAATFFYDVYGFAALRGDGINMADNLAKDCDSSSACPITFSKSFQAAPGAIISLYPNHVAVVVEVKDNGNVVIADGNVGKNHNIRTGIEYKSIVEYASANGLTIKSIAIPNR